MSTESIESSPDGALPEPSTSAASSESPSEVATSEASADEAKAAEARPPVLVHGTPVSPGLAIGPAHFGGLELDQVRARRVPLDEVEKELNRFQRGLTVAREQLGELKERLSGHVAEEQVRVLDTHLAYLKDSVFLSDVENLVLGDRMCLEGAIAKVILDFDRIFRLVENVMLRERAVDLRDVGIRVLRCLEEEGPEVQPEAPEGGYVLVTRELSIVDMFPVGSGEVRAILSESGSLTSHAAILARSLRIPTLTDVDGLLETLEEGDSLIVDATEGVIRVRPDDVVREQFREAQADWLEARSGGEEATLPVDTADGHAVDISATCGNLPEVERAVELGATAIGLYRTELLYLVDRKLPSQESLTAHYRAVLDQARGEVVFRLLDVDSGLELDYLHDEVEANPELGVNGVRLLLAHESLLRRQLAAMLKATGPERVLRIAVPKVVEESEVARVRAILEEERRVLSQDGPVVRGVRVGAVLETPASLFSVRGLAEVSDFFVAGLDSLQQYMLAADRENPELSRFFRYLHPAVLRALVRLDEECRELDRPLRIFGITATRAANVRLLLGVGLHRLSVSPVAIEGVARAVRETELRDARRAGELATRAGSLEELEQQVRD